MAATTEHDMRELGLWWLADAPEKQVPGILTYSPTEGAQLELIGMLRGPFDAILSTGLQRFTADEFERDGDYGRICGAAGGKSFTLDGCFRTDYSNTFPSATSSSTERIHVHRFIRGAEFFPNEPVEATEIRVRLLHLPYWIAEGGISERFYLPGEAPKGEPAIVLEADPLPNRVIELANGMTLSICEVVESVGDRVTDRGLTRDFVVRLEGERLEFDEYLHVIGTFQDLVSIGTDRTSTFEEFRFHHPDVVHKRGDKPPVSLPIDFYAQWLNWSTRQTKPPRPHDLLFNLSELGGEEAIRRWFAFALDHRGTISRVMATRYRSGAYVSDTLLNRAAALEALDRDTHGRDGIDFRKGMSRLAALAGAPFLDAIGDAERWATSFKDARIAAAHHSNERSADSVHSDYYLAEAAYYRLFAIERGGALPG